MSRRKIRVKNIRKFVVNILSLLVIIMISTLIIGHSKKSNKDDISPATLEVSNSKTLNTTKENVDKSRSNNVSQNKEVPKQENDNNTIKDKQEKMSLPNKEYFKDSLFLGDSITEAMSFFDILDERNVKGIIGLTISKAKAAIDNMQGEKPKRIFILLGNNDIGNNIEMNMNNYTKLLNRIKTKLPDTKIYVQGILPVTEKAVKKDKCLKEENINKFNEALKENCQKENVNFIDLTSIVENANKSIYEPDGIHFKEPFYKLWLDYLKNTLKD
ncbi:GDSL-type esterase/lipase family protein [Clostridium botulinum]|uniref:Acetylhydrolase n=1 Tax=Clostridium botulinum TaxID=1491 RepID=A0A9Q1ZB61_CLOBO|nr:GDSL-type esterase/lipase family protein [Clostridium botulinum]KEI02830.1 acetylhydrolase [Clostridium botulinum C/D str. Sp77]KLU75153.1 acetylhydrolase [Clostridium botulinum V891]KOA73326.1 acetylhydrolase [Clostridium botulinum]KOA80725.1 acetylhydrolase [Clostridium botulinum]KOA82703.1 acetylhydrolase [Clostridium botulinum]